MNPLRRTIVFLAFASALPVIAFLAAFALPAVAQQEAARATPPQEALPAQPAAAPQEFDSRPAMAAAEAWLALVDAGRYADSWESAAAIFRAGITRPEWEKLAHAVRGGNAAGQRKLRAATHTSSLPGAPPGEYVVIQFDTPLANRPGAIETLATMREGGSWKVAGYFIR